MKYIEAINELSQKSTQAAIAYIGGFMDNEQLISKLQEFNTEYIQKIHQI